MSLSADQIERYSRHILLQDVGGTGQEKLLAGKVLIIGAGGLGAPIALYLAGGNRSMAIAIAIVFAVAVNALVVSMLLHLRRGGTGAGRK